MKRIRGTKYAHIGTSYHPRLENFILQLKNEVEEQIKRYDKLIDKVEKMKLEENINTKKDWLSHMEEYRAYLKKYHE